MSFQSTTTDIVKDKIKEEAELLEEYLDESDEFCLVSSEEDQQGLFMTTEDQAEKSTSLTSLGACEWGQ